jgi:tRNA G18 (ribose-2'-O)-methylase SpoU
VPEKRYVREQKVSQVADILVCLVLGREDRGVRQGIIALSDAVVHLPMYGMTNSLNVSTVAAVLMYHLVGKLAQ